MICECGARMQWRCTDTKTKIAKYKCPSCGRVATCVDTWKPVKDEKRICKYFYINKKGMFVINKRIQGNSHYFGSYGNEETARSVISKLKECDWDKSMVPVILDELCIDRVKGTWVMA